MTAKVLSFKKHFINHDKAEYLNARQRSAVIAKKTDEFIANGGVIQEIEAGVSNCDPMKFPISNTFIIPTGY